MLCGLEEMARFLREHDNFAVITHFKPDGDAYGSALGLVHLLRGMGKRAFPVCDDPVERKYQFLPGWEEFTNAEKGLPFQPETALGVDVSDASRMGKSEVLYRSCPHRAAIDHHASNVGFAPCTLLEAEAASAGEIVVKLSAHMEESLSKDVAQQLYTAIVTDSGNFSFRDTSGDTLRAAALCVDAGIDVDELTRRLFRTRTAAGTRLLGLALSGYTLCGQGRVAGLMISEKMFEESGATSADAHSIVNYMNEIAGASIGILCEQAPGVVRISFRSAGNVDVIPLAQRFGGGGHKAASGARVEGGTLEEVFEQVLDAACEYLGVER